MSVLGDLFGSKPSVPDLPSLDLGTEQNKAVQNNLNVAPAAGKLANATLDQITQMLDKVTGGNFSSIQNQIGSNISSLLQGKIPTDVSNQIQNSAAARALTGGFNGTGLSGNLTARDLGLTSLQLTGQGISSAQSWLASAEQLLNPAISTFTSMFVTPGQQAAFDQSEREAQFQRQWMQSQINAMPDPQAVGLVATFTAGAPYWLGGYKSGQGTPSSPGTTGSSGNSLPSNWNWGGGGTSNGGQAASWGNPNSWDWSTGGSGGIDAPASLNSDSGGSGSGLVGSLLSLV